VRGIDLIRAFGKLFDEVGPETPEEIDEELREAGYDPDEVGRRFKELAAERFRQKQGGGNDSREHSKGT